jgi:hypothetical protein
VGHAALGLVAVNLPLLRNHAPQKWKQRLAPLGNIVAPEFALEFVAIGPDAAMFAVHESGVGPGENLLPA